MTDPNDYTIGPYHLEARLRQGIHTVDYLAQHIPSGQPVALALFSEELSEQPGFTRHFLESARAVSALQHPNILPILDYGLYHHTPYLINPYLQHGSLAGWLQQVGIMSLSDVLAMFNQVAPALDHAHQQGLVHGNLSLADLMIADDGAIQIAGIGVFGMTPVTIHQGQIYLIGDPVYMAPEVAATGYVSPASDVYSLGIVIFEALAGQPPFIAETPLQYVWLHTRQPVPSIHDIRPDIPESLEAVIKVALAKEPDDRLPSAGAFLSTFQTALFGHEYTLKGEGHTAPITRVSSQHQARAATYMPTYPSSAPPSAVQAWNRSPLWLQASIAILVVFFCGALGVLLSLPVLTAFANWRASQRIPTPTEAQVVQEIPQTTPGPPADAPPSATVPYVWPTLFPTSSEWPTYTAWPTYTPITPASASPVATATPLNTATAIFPESGGGSAPTQAPGGVAPTFPSFEPTNTPPAVQRNPQPVFTFGVIIPDTP
jgi:serine/threonine protein kinase